jgi:hypothetical protein
LTEGAAGKGLRSCLGGNTRSSQGVGCNPGRGIDAKGKTVNGPVIAWASVVSRPVKIAIVPRNQRSWNGPELAPVRPAKGNQREQRASICDLEDGAVILGASRRES